MRRLILEVSEKELSKLGIKISPFQKIEFLELLHLLRQDHEEFAAIWRVKFKDSSSKIEDLLDSEFLIEIQLLEQEKNGALIIFMKGGPILSSVLDSVGAIDGYLFPPLDIRDGMLKISFLGNERQVKSFLENMGIKGIRYRVTLLTDANFAPDSPLNQLTEKQRAVLVTAYTLGYYAIPRRINSDALAKRLDIANSTLIEHLRKAEQRLLIHLLTQKNDFQLKERKIDQD